MTRVITGSDGRKYLTDEPLLHPPHRTWVGLTRDEKFEIINRLLGEDWVYTLDAAEDLLQKKNT